MNTSTTATDPKQTPRTESDDLQRVLHAMWNDIASVQEKYDALIDHVHDLEEEIASLKKEVTRRAPPKQHNPFAGTEPVKVRLFRPSK